MTVIKIIIILYQPLGATKTGDNALPISTGPVIANIIGTKDTKIWRDTMIETGMYWIGKLFLIPSYRTVIGQTILCVIPARRSNSSLFLNLPVRKLFVTKSCVMSFLEVFDSLISLKKVTSTFGTFHLVVGASDLFDNSR